MYIFLIVFLIDLSVFTCNVPMSPVDIWCNMSAFITIIIIMKKLSSAFELEVFWSYCFDIALQAYIF